MSLYDGRRLNFWHRDRDAKQRWASNVVSSNWSLGFGGIGGQILTGAVKRGVSKVFS